MRQVVQRRKRRTVGQSRRRLDHAGLAVRAAVRDLEDAAGLAAQLPRDRVEIRSVNHREEAGWAERVAGADPAVRAIGSKSAKHRAAHRQWCATATCTTGSPLVDVVGCDCRAASARRAFAGNCTWYGISPGITKPSRSRACAAMNTGSASLTFCCFEFGDLRTQLLLGRLQLLHLGALRRSRCAPDRRWSASARR